jgi:molybdopterin/thiamine biosynthesis adenylyltransferase
MNSRTVGFVLLKDLLSAILENIEPSIKKKYKREFEILFGTITFQPPGSDHQIALPIGDIPISLTKLNYFFVDKLIGKNMTVYTFQQFFEDLFNDFFVKAVENAMRLRSSNDTIQKNSFNLDYLQLYGRDGKFTVLQEEGPAPQLEVLYIYGNSVGNVETFNSQDNLANKIPHMYFGGVDRGIVKKIKFSDNTNAKTKAAIWEQNRGDNSGNDRSKYGGTLTPLVYNADATLIGYPYIINGNTIFIDTAALGLNEGKAVDLLLGGYYVVTKVVHELTVDKFETKISAILTADYRLKGKIKEKVNILPADFRHTTPDVVYDSETEKINQKAKEQLVEHERKMSSRSIQLNAFKKQYIPEGSE